MPAYPNGKKKQKNKTPKENKHNPGIKLQI